jgi:hypothetical protein
LVPHQENALVLHHDRRRPNPMFHSRIPYPNSIILPSPPMPIDPNLATIQTV